ncbi:MAG: hypothetical protein ACXVPU_17735 [Bacteroidia bacterium]
MEKDKGDIEFDKHKNKYTIGLRMQRNGKTWHTITAYKKDYDYLHPKDKDKGYEVVIETICDEGFPHKFSIAEVIIQFGT